MKRVPTRELLDDDNGTPAEIAASLDDLRAINRRWGGVSTTEKMVEQVAAVTGKSSFSLLEVASGTGDVPHELRARLEPRGIRLRFTLLDRSRAHLLNGDSLVIGDGLRLPFEDASFDLVSCGLFAHHLSPEEVVRFAREALRCSSIALLINDLIRDPIHLAMVYLGCLSFRSRITRHDAPASVRQAYTIDEMQRMLSEAGARRVEIAQHYLYRMGAIAWK
ncbi:MAG TPA: methyltransferase domain-containing protein [Terriglobales bacterium]|nr:methyltransferase domain-containing protein [Terriglobales bacterium]